MKKILKCAFFAIVLLLLFIIISCSVPPACQKKATAEALADYKSETATKERVLCVDDNLDALLWRIRIIEEAEREIILSTFDFCDDDSGRTVMGALYAAAERGVQVKILVDGLNGSVKLENNDAFCALAAHPSVEVKLYNKLNLFTPWTVNYRMHDKYLIADQCAYLIGGRNTMDLFLGEGGETYNIDREVLVWSDKESASAGELKDYFERVFSEKCNTEIRGNIGEKRLELGRAALREKYAEAKKRYPGAFGFTDWEEETVAADGVSFLFGETHNGNKAPVVWKNILALADGADEVLIETPYIVCSDEMYSDISMLAEKRVAIMTNAVESGANPWGCTDYMNQKGNISATGAEIYEYMGEQSLHTKTFLIGNSISVVGSYNLDMRSTYLDTEIMLVVDCPQLNSELREKFYERTLVSKHVLPDGTETEGEAYEARTLDPLKAVWYFILRCVMLVLRHLA